MTGPDCAVMCSLIHTHTDKHTDKHNRLVYFSPIGHFFPQGQRTRVLQRRDLRHPEVSRTDDVDPLPGLEVSPPHVTEHRHVTVAGGIFLNLVIKTDKKQEQKQHTHKDTHTHTQVRFVQVERVCPLCRV